MKTDWPRWTDVDSKRNSVWKVRQYMSISAFTDLVTSSKVMWRSLSVEPLTDDLQQTTHGKQGKGAAQINQGSLVGQWNQPGFISRSVEARLQVSLCSGYDVCHPGWPKVGFFVFWPWWPWKVDQTRQMSQLCQVHLWCKFGDNKHINIFHDDLITL